MSEVNRVTVYNFVVFEGGVEFDRVMGFKATREAIENRFEGRLMKGSAESVDEAELDANGCYVRLPTGWGDLGPH